MSELSGVKLTAVTNSPDSDGYWRDVFKVSRSRLSKAAEVSVIMSYPGSIRAFNYHPQRDRMWYCVKGMIQLVLYDRRKQSKTKGLTQVITMGDHQTVAVYVPRGVTYGFKVVGNEQAWVLVAGNREGKKGEISLSTSDAEIGFDWTVKPR